MWEIPQAEGRSDDRRTLMAQAVPDNDELAERRAKAAMSTTVGASRDTGKAAS